MDPFQIRMDFLSQLRRLNASQQSIQKVVAFAVRYGSRCGEDLWECLIEECEKANLNARINILYLLDALLEASLVSAAPSTAAENDYVFLTRRDLRKVVQLVVPEEREGILNLGSARQILESWRLKRVLDPGLIESIERELLDERKKLYHSVASVGQNGETGAFENFSRQDVFRRIEEDRERHKRLRERMWILSTVSAQDGPAPRNAPSLPSSADPSPASPFDSYQATDAAAVKSKAAPDVVRDGAGPPGLSGIEAALDIEFDQAWETTSDLNEDDIEAIREDSERCWPNR